MASTGNGGGRRASQRRQRKPAAHASNGRAQKESAAGAYGELRHRWRPASAHPQVAGAGNENTSVGGHGRRCELAAGEGGERRRRGRAARAGDGGGRRAPQCLCQKQPVRSCSGDGRRARATGTGGERPTAGGAAWLRAPVAGAGSVRRWRGQAVCARAPAAGCEVPWAATERTRQGRARFRGGAFSGGLAARSMAHELFVQ